MSSVNLHFVTIPGKRTLVTLPKEFQLSDMLHMIRSQIYDNAVEDCVFFCKGRRLLLNDPAAFQNQKSKLINNGAVILIGKRMSSCERNQTIREESKKDTSITLYFITTSGERIVSKIPGKFTRSDFLKVIDYNFGKNCQDHACFICMGQELNISNRLLFEKQRPLIREGSLIFLIAQSENRLVRYDDDHPVLMERTIIEKFCVLLPFLVFLIFYT
ncbi:unnamed protein product [Adineta ricciae]|uniref:Ubiquitin-like domain-containing protein n=1 Tax=Adineta ricciae TaxID=249248 RepID=A0A814MI26_ADIRI|nr:unnamed protein product [Adineta ricciae]